VKTSWDFRTRGRVGDAVLVALGREEVQNKKEEGCHLERGHRERRDKGSMRFFGSR